MPVFAVYAVVDCDKAYIVPSKNLHSVANLEIVAPPAGKVFHNADTDFAAFHIFNHAGVGRTVKEPAAFVVVAHGKAGVKGCNFAIISHVHNLLCVHVCVIYT